MLLFAIIGFTILSDARLDVRWSSENGSIEQKMTMAKMFSSTRNDEILELLNEAENAERHGDFDGAASLYQSVLEIDDTNERALESLMKLYREMGRGDDAIRVARALCQVNPELGARPLMELLNRSEDVEGAESTAPMGNNPALPQTSSEDIPSSEFIFAESDYRIAEDRELAALCTGCLVIARLVNGCLRGDRLTRDEQSVLIHTVGRLRWGPAAVNTLLGSTVRGTLRLEGRLFGIPPSCSEIRQRIGLYPGENGCGCSFDAMRGAYPHPLRHLVRWKESEYGHCDGEPAIVPLFPGIPGTGRIPDA